MGDSPALYMYSDKTVKEIREELGIEPVEGPFSETNANGERIHYGSTWPKNPFDIHLSMRHEWFEPDTL